MRRALLAGTALVLVAAGAAWGQGSESIEWDYTGVTCGFELDDAITVVVTGLSGEANIDWGDGDVESITGDGDYSHSYDSPGEYVARLVDLDGTELASTFDAGIYTYSLTPFPASLAIDEELTATVEALPDDLYIGDTGEVDWGDGSSPVDAKDSGDYFHAYDSPGNYTLQLYAGSPGDCLFATTDVDVLAPVITVDPTGPRLDEPVSVTVDEEPVGGSLEWGNGESASLDGSGQYQLPNGYEDDVTYTIEVETATGVVAAAEFATVRTPSLTVDPNSVSIGEEVTATITDGPEGGELAWGDGDVETGLSGDEVLFHSYGTGDTYLLELRRSNGETVASRSVGVDSSTFDVAPNEANIGETVTADVTGEPNGGSIDWGDGNISPLDDSGSYEHEFGTGGDFTVELLDASQDPLASRSVSITEPELVLSTASARQGEPVEAVVTVVGNATVEWGDGAETEVDGPEVALHRYASPGSYGVQLVRSGAMVASDDVEVLTPQLDLLTAAPAAVGETVTVGVSNAPFDAQLEWGDGEFLAGVTDADYDHSYGNGGDFEVELVDAWQGSIAASLELTVAEPDEAISVDAITYRGADGEIEVALTLDGLAVGQDYTLQSTDVFEILPDVASVESVSVTFLQSGTHTLQLSRQDSGEVRATRDLELEWPRANEGIEIVNDAPHLEGDFVEFELTGLNPDYTYTFDPDDDSGFERVIEGESTSIELARYSLEGSYEPTLTVTYPGHFAESEVRDSLFLDVSERTGMVEMQGDELPYGLETSFELSELVPGATYRLDFGDGEAEEFVAFGPMETIEHAYTSMPSSIDLESRIEGAGVWEWLDSADPPLGMTFTGLVALEQDGTVVGDVQTFVGSGLVPGESYRFVVARGSVTGESTPLVTSDPVVANSDGVATVDISIPRALREENAFNPTELFTQLYLQFDEDTTAWVDTVRFALPPLRRTLADYVLEITDLQRPFRIEQWTDSDFDAIGTIFDMELGGRLQGDVEFAFEGLYQADLREPLELDMPARLNGLELTFTQLRLAARVVGFDAGFAGTGTLEGVDFEFSSGMTQEGVPVDGDYFSQTFQFSGELLLSASYRGWMPVGDTGWRVGREGFDGWFILDLSEEEMYQLSSSVSDGLAIEDAYRSWEAAGRSPGVDPASDSWTGVFFPPTYQTRIMRDPEEYSSANSFAFIDPPSNTDAIVWTSSGFHFMYHGNEYVNQTHGWNTTPVSPYEAAVVDSQVVAEVPARVTIDLPFFEKPYLIGLVPDDSGPFGRGAAMVPQMPVARDFGMTAVIADQPRFVMQESGGAADLVFDRAAWTMDQDLAKNGDGLDSTVASSMRDDANQNMDLPPELQAGFDGTLAALATAESLLRLQLPLDGLTFSPVSYGSDETTLSVNGSTWKTLAATPEMDMYGFPYMSGANSEIGIKREGDEYAIGLRGSLSLGGIVRANAAPSWYHVRDGSEVRWVFEGVSAALGDEEGLVPLPASFSMTVGGLISLDPNDASLEFNGAGELTVSLSGGGKGSGQGTTGSTTAARERGLNIQVAGVFGINDSTADEAPYWFVWAGTDLAQAGTPIPIKVQGVDVFAFYAFRGGIGHNLRLDQRTGNPENDTCAVDDGFVGESDDARPAVVRNALDCFDDTNDLALMAGTLIGWHQSNSPSELYGLIWHLNTNLTINSSGQVVLGGRGWAMRNLDDGYRSDATPNMIARISGDENAILGSFCLGDVNDQTIGELDCEGLAAVSYSVAGLKVLEATANAELKASWSSGEYYFALGRESLPISIFVFPRETSGYFVAGYINTPGIIEGSIPAGGVWASMYVGNDYRWSYSQDVFFCTLEAYAYAYFSFGGAIGVQFVPAFQFDGRFAVSAGAGAGGSCGSVNIDVGVSLYASGRITAPDPFQFSGMVRATADLPVVGDIDVTVPQVTIGF